MKKVTLEGYGVDRGGSTAQEGKGGKCDVSGMARQPFCCEQKAHVMIYLMYSS